MINQSHPYKYQFQSSVNFCLHVRLRMWAILTYKFCVAIQVSMHAEDFSRRSNCALYTDHQTEIWKALQNICLDNPDIPSWAAGDIKLPNVEWESLCFVNNAYLSF